MKFALLAVLLFASCDPPQPVSVVKPKPPVSVQLLSTRFEQVTDENAVIHGEVRNTSKESIDLVKIVATVYDKRGQIKTTGWTLAELKPLAPNQTSPFSVWVTTSGPVRYKIDITDKFDKPIAP